MNENRTAQHRLLGDSTPKTIKTFRRGGQTPASKREKTPQVKSTKYSSSMEAQELTFTSKAQQAHRKSEMHDAEIEIQLLSRDQGRGPLSDNQEELMLAEGKRRNSELCVSSSNSSESQMLSHTEELEQPAKKAVGIETVQILPPNTKLNKLESNHDGRFEIGGTLVYDSYANMTGNEKIVEYFSQTPLEKVDTNFLFSKEEVKEAWTNFFGEKGRDREFTNENDKTIFRNLTRFSPQRDFSCLQTDLRVPQIQNVLVFDSRFENGNLRKVSKVNNVEYNLWLENDHNTKGHTQWFYFKVIYKDIPLAPEKKTHKIKFNLLNLAKTASLYQEGMMPCIWSKKRHEEDGTGWFRGAVDITYTQNDIPRYTESEEIAQAGHNSFLYNNNGAGEGVDNYFTLSFKYEFEPNQNDEVWFAHAIPYTYTRMQKHIKQIVDKEENQQFLKQNILCLSLAKHPVPLLTITDKIETYLDYYTELRIKQLPSIVKKAFKLMYSNAKKLFKQSLQANLKAQKLLEAAILENIKYFCEKNEEELKDLFPLSQPNDMQAKLYSYIMDHCQKRTIFITSRVHPGEPQASYMLDGMLEFLQTEKARPIRENFVIRIVPVLNPDGVIYGNYRCSLLGCDLNRKWDKPNRILHPTIYYSKNLIKSMHQERKVFLYSDLHGHSRKQNAFFYGCCYKNYEQEGRVKNAHLRLIPLMCCQKSKLFSLKNCRFQIERSKESTARVVIFKEYNIMNSFTLECSFYGKEDPNDQPQSTQQDQQRARPMMQQMVPKKRRYEHMTIPEYQSLGSTMISCMSNFLPQEAQKLQFLSGKIFELFYEEFTKFVPPFILKREEEKMLKMEQEKQEKEGKHQQQLKRKSIRTSLNKPASVFELAESSKQAPNNQESREELDDDSFQSENDYMSANDQKPEEDFSELQNLFEDIKNVVKQNQESKKAKKSGKDSSDGSSNYEQKQKVKKKRKDKTQGLSKIQSSNQVNTQVRVVKRKTINFAVPTRVCMAAENFKPLKAAKPAKDPAEKPSRRTESRRTEGRHGSIFKKNQQLKEAPKSEFSPYQAHPLTQQQVQQIIGNHQDLENANSHEVIEEIKQFLIENQQTFSRESNRQDSKGVFSGSQQDRRFKEGPKSQSIPQPVPQPNSVSQPNSNTKVHRNQMLKFIPEDLKESQIASTINISLQNSQVQLSPMEMAPLKKVKQQAEALNKSQQQNQANSVYSHLVPKIQDIKSGSNNKFQRVLARKINSKIFNSPLNNQYSSIQNSQDPFMHKKQSNLQNHSSFIEMGNGLVQGMQIEQKRILVSDYSQINTSNQVVQLPQLVPQIVQIQQVGQRAQRDQIDSKAWQSENNRNNAQSVSTSIQNRQLHPKSKHSAVIHFKNKQSLVDGSQQQYKEVILDPYQTQRQRVGPSLENFHSKMGPPTLIQQDYGGLVESVGGFHNQGGMPIGSYIGAGQSSQEHMQRSNIFSNLQINQIIKGPQNPVQFQHSPRPAQGIKSKEFKGQSGARMYFSQSKDRINIPGTVIMQKQKFRTDTKQNTEKTRMSYYKQAFANIQLESSSEIIIADEMPPRVQSIELREQVYPLSAQNTVLDNHRPLNQVQYTQSGALSKMKMERSDMIFPDQDSLINRSVSYKRRESINDILRKEKTGIQALNQPTFNQSFNLNSNDSQMKFQINRNRGNIDFSNKKRDQEGGYDYDIANKQNQLQAQLEQQQSLLLKLQHQLQVQQVENFNNQSRYNMVDENQRVSELIENGVFSSFMDSGDKQGHEGSSILEKNVNLQEQDLERYIDPRSLQQMRTDPSKADQFKMFRNMEQESIEIIKKQLKSPENKSKNKSKSNGAKQKSNKMTPTQNVMAMAIQQKGLQLSQVLQGIERNQFVPKIMGQQKNQEFSPMVQQAGRDQIYSNSQQSHLPQWAQSQKTQSLSSKNAKLLGSTPVKRGRNGPENFLTFEEENKEEDSPDPYREHNQNSQPQHSDQIPPITNFVQNINMFF